MWWPLPQTLTLSSIVRDMSQLNIEEALEQIKSALEQPLRGACVLIMDGAKVNCPVDTGRLQGSITYDVDGLEGRVGTDVEYAPYVHEGTSRMAARPFLRDAAEEKKGEILELFKGALG